MPVSQHSDLTLKLDPNRQHESRSMLGFQNKVSDIILLKFHSNRDNWAYLKKYDFQRKLIFQIWGCGCICGIEMSPEVVSYPDFDSQLALHAKQDNFNLQFRFEKHGFRNISQHRQYIYIYHFKEFFLMSKNPKLLPQNKAPFGSNLVAKFWLHGETC